MTVMPGAEVEIVDLTEIVGEHDIVCDYSDRVWCTGEGARWVGFVRCEECGYHSQRLICDPCKNLVTSTEGGCRCPVCNGVYVPFRHAFSRFEPLERKR